MLRVSVTDVISMHENVINVYGGIHGIRDKVLLSSIVSGVFQTFGGNELYPTDKDKVCRLYYMFVTNQVFLDGNKRTATALCMFLNKKYGIKSNVFDVNNPHRLSLDVANGNISYDDLLEMW